MKKVYGSNEFLSRRYDPYMTHFNHNQHDITCSHAQARGSRLLNLLGCLQGPVQRLGHANILLRDINEDPKAVQIIREVQEILSSAYNSQTFSFMQLSPAMCACSPFTRDYILQ